MTREPVTNEPLVIRKEIEIEAPPARVWPFIGTAAGYARWACPPAGEHDVVLEPKVGGRFEDRMVVGGREYRSVGEIAIYEPPYRLSVTEHSASGDLAGALHASTFTITLTDLGGRTRVTVEHTGFESLPADRRRDAFESFDQGWAYAVEELRIVVGLESLPEPGTAAGVRRHLIRKEIDIAAPIERVWWFVGSQAGSLQRHRAENIPGAVEYQTEILEDHVGGRYELRGIYASRPLIISGQVLAYNPPRLLILSWREDGWPTETRVTFRLRERVGQTRVTVLHSGFERLPEAIQERVLGEYEAGRQRGLDVLRTLLEPGAPDESERWIIRREVTIEAPAVRVWPFVATRDGLASWWTSTRSLIFEERDGGRFEIVVEFDGRQYIIAGRVLTYDPPRSLRLTWRELDGDAGEWPADTTVTFSLLETGGQTRVVVEHSGFERLPEAVRAAMHRSYEHGWTQEEMERLRGLVLRRRE